MDMIRCVDEQKKGKKTETEQICQKGRYQVGFSFQHQLSLTAALDVPVAENLKAGSALILLDGLDFWIRCHMTLYDT